MRLHILWTDFELFGDPRIAGYHATQNMTDYKKIRVSPAYPRGYPDDFNTAFAPDLVASV